MGGKGSGDVLHLSVGGMWSLQRWHGKVIPLGASIGGGVVCLYVHVVLRSNSQSNGGESSMREGDELRELSVLV